MFNDKPVSFQVSLDRYNDFLKHLFNGWLLFGFNYLAGIKDIKHSYNVAIIDLAAFSGIAYFYTGMKKLPLSFYDREDVVMIARESLGKIIVSHAGGKKTSGRIVETGTHLELLAKGNVYAQLHSRQFEEDTDAHTG